MLNCPEKSLRAVPNDSAGCVVTATDMMSTVPLPRAVPTRGRRVKELPAVGTPDGGASAIRRHLKARTRTWIRVDVHLEPAGSPEWYASQRPSGDRSAPPVVGERPGDFSRLALADHVAGPQDRSRLLHDDGVARNLVVEELTAVGRPPSGLEIPRALEQALGGAAAVGANPVEVVRTLRAAAVGDPFAVRRPHRRRAAARAGELAQRSASEVVDPRARDRGRPSPAQAVWNRG